MKGNQYATGYKWTKEQRENINRAGENAAHYIDGRWMEKHCCVDCGKELTTYKAKRCKSALDHFLIGTQKDPAQLPEYKKDMCAPPQS